MLLSLVLAGAAWTTVQAASGNTLVGWNDLGMHCMDGHDFSVFSILPPYNVIHAQMISNSLLLTSSNGITVTYEAVADVTGSFNSTSQGKVNFWQYAPDLFGVNLAPDMGLAGFPMPGTNNQPQAMIFETSSAWFTAKGVPIVPYDDAGQKNTYPMLRLTARDAAHNVLATTDIVLPVSDEMDCRACHLSGSSPAGMPFAGWVWDVNRDRDYKLNILRLHDDYRFNKNAYVNYLTQAGYNTNGLYVTAAQDAKPILCARCHASNALGTTGFSGIPPLTSSMHASMAYSPDPVTGLPLDSSANRSACYRCHPGAETRCLRGAMGKAVGADGRLAMQCQSCHGSMLTVGSTNRQGWLEEPACQSCHTGTATSNNGQIRYTSVYDANGQVRQAVNGTFATTPNVPAAGLSLYRFSTGHGGLQCEACHGSTHAEYPSLQPNDNVQSARLQGHTGVLLECTACHAQTPSTITGGPHGMHPVGQTWVSRHSDAVEQSGAAVCQACHGADYRGTVLSRAHANRTLSAFGTKQFWTGFQVGCYNCHQGPGSEGANPNSPPVVADASATTTSGAPVLIPLSATDANGNTLTLRIVSQPANGTVALTNSQATYYPQPGFTGSDSFTFAANDASTDSNLGTARITVTQGAFSLACATAVPPKIMAGVPAPFWASPTISNYNASATFDWNFGDGAHATNQYAVHAYQTAGLYSWYLLTSVGGTLVTNTGSITVNPVPPAIRLSVEKAGDQVVLAWSSALTNFVLQSCNNLSSSNIWTSLTNPPALTGELNRVTNNLDSNRRFYRLHKP